MPPHPSLKAYLAATKTTQEVFAWRLGITQSALSMIVNGKRAPRLPLALKIHDLTGVPLEALLRKKKRRAGRRAA
jgi:DNA-binding XRE family transcriptional regulator